jgi:3-oxoacyl-[acyl-carrier-protein] synthase I
MMNKVFIIADNVISPVGSSSEENFYALTHGISGVVQHTLPAFSPEPFFASLLATKDYAGRLPKEAAAFTKFEQLLLLSLSSAVKQTSIDITAKDVIVIISSTKGNISLLETAGQRANSNDAIGLSDSAKRIADFCGLQHTPLVVRNACISGLTALLTGKRLLETGQYSHAVVVGADIISEFILSGFQSFQAISTAPCRPFDAARKGINLGEAAATMVLSTQAANNAICIAGGAVTNDANHISGPSRSGQELCLAIQKAMRQANVSVNDIGFISAHGTATLYNDEMEARAFSLAGMESIPINSLKGYYGHTLGAAGVVESVMAIHSLHQNTMIATKGFHETGVSKPVTICRTTMPLMAQHCLKTASGFGGCNAALVFSKTVA